MVSSRLIMAFPASLQLHAVTRVERLAFFFCLVLHLVTASAVYDKINGGISRLRKDDSEGIFLDNLIDDSSENMSLFVEASAADNWAKVFSGKDISSNSSKQLNDNSSGTVNLVSDRIPENGVRYYIVPDTELQVANNKKLRTRTPRHAEIAHSTGIQEYTTNGGRTRAFLSFHAPPVRRISSIPASSSDPTSFQTPMGSVNADLQQRLSKMLDPTKSIVNIFVYKSPSSSSQDRQPKAHPRVHQVTPSGTNTKQYRSVDYQNEVDHFNLPDELKGVGKYPNIRKGELVFAKQVNRFSPLLQHLMSDQNDIQEATVLGQQTVDVQDQEQKHEFQQQHQTQQYQAEPIQQNRFNFRIQPHVNNQLNHVNSFNDVRTPLIENSKANSVSNNQFYNAQSTQTPSHGTSHSTSNIYFNSYPGFSTLRNPFQIPPSTSIYNPSNPFSSNKRSLVPRFQDPFISRSFQANQPHQFLRPAIPDSFAEATNHGNQIAASHSKPSGRSFTGSAPSCGMCEHLDGVSGACVFDPCCPLRLAGFAGVAC